MSTYINCLSIEIQLGEEKKIWRSVVKGNEYGGDAQVGRMEVIKRDWGLSVAVQTQTQPQDTDSN